HSPGKLEVTSSRRERLANWSRQRVGDLACVSVSLICATSAPSNFQISCSAFFPRKSRTRTYVSIMQLPDKQGNNRDGFGAIIGLMAKRAFAITGGVSRGRNKGKSPHRPFQKACFPSPKGH